MDAGTGKIAGALILLATFWIAVYWFWTPKPHISSASDAAHAPTREVSPRREGDSISPPRDGTGPLPARVGPKPQVREVDPGAEPKPPRPIAVVPPEFFEHTIQPGETFTSIAEKYYGDPRLAHAVAAANPFVSPTSLRPGRTIRVAKDPNNIQGVPVKPPASKDEPAKPEAPREYVVASGDTLSGIAKRLLGSTKYADDIYKANRDRLASPDDLRVGQTLRIPKVD